jgi:hypothetical protein
MARVGSVLMYADDSYLVRVTSVAGAAGSFVWEVCRGDSLLVLQRSTKIFPTPIEALFGSARSAAVLALGTVPHAAGEPPGTGRVWIGSGHRLAFLRRTIVYRSLNRR